MGAFVGGEATAAGAEVTGSILADVQGVFPQAEIVEDAIQPERTSEDLSPPTRG